VVRASSKTRHFTNDPSTLPMALCTRCLSRIARTPIRRTQWYRIQRRFYASTENDSIQNLLTTYDEQSNGEWFEKLRQEMLSRELPLLIDRTDAMREMQLYSTLRSSSPDRWKSLFRLRESTNALGSVGNHLVYFNPKLPTKGLLSDGTDTLHSPGAPFVRRMWAGGSVRVNTDMYFDVDRGWQRDMEYVCVERIKDVRLHGQDDTAKIFVTVERQFVRRRIVPTGGDAGISTTQNEALYFRKQLSTDGWGSAFLIEERNLVFMRERSTTELADIKSGKITPTRYLDPPGTPDFSHTLTPTSALLFRFSALTFNAHAIHLDRNFCRNVEGHRNLLVHGPLTLMLMLKLVSGHLVQQTGAPHTVQSIEYRNLAPLYCDEAMRICAREKTSLRTDDGGIYDVWIEGPTGGMAVKGTVRTANIAKHVASDRDASRTFRRVRILKDGVDNPKDNSSDSTSGVTTPSLYSTVRQVLDGKESSTLSDVIKALSQPKSFNPTPFSVPKVEKPRTSPPTPKVPTLQEFTPAIPLNGISIRPRSDKSMRKLRSRRAHSTTTTQTEQTTIKQANTSKPSTTQNKPPPTQEQHTTVERHPTLRKIRRLVAPPQPMRAGMSLASRRIILQTIQRRNRQFPKYSPVSIIRLQAAKSRPTTFERRSVRSIVPNSSRVRHVVPKPKGWQENKRLQWQGWEAGVWKRRRGGRARIGYRYSHSTKDR
jgi:hydroxyacyl-ACP dehydratase HTD2-like protein with hotdog domain